MNLIIFEDAGYLDLAPLTWLRPAFELRCGRDTLIEKMRTHLRPTALRAIVRAELAAAVRERHAAFVEQIRGDAMLLNARAMVTADLAPPPLGVAWMRDGAFVAMGVGEADAARLTIDDFLLPARFDALLARCKRVDAPDVVKLIRHPWELPIGGPVELRRQLRDGGVIDGQVYSGAHLLNNRAIHIGHGAKIKPGAVLDAEDGPIHIDRDVIVQPNAVIEGPCFVGARSIVRPGAVLREGTTIGPVCKVGGEIEASVMQGYCNKQHDGFLGHSYVGSWVNLGADTVTSDLKNTYGTIRARINGVEVETGQRFVGSTIGDHSKTGIGTILPTGCVVGICAQVFTSGTVPKFVPSFSWLTEAGLEGARVDKVIEIARTVMSRRHVMLSEAEVELLKAAATKSRAAEELGWR